MSDETLLTRDPQAPLGVVSDLGAAQPSPTKLADPRALRALAHPARLAILERLQDRGPATATECAEVTGLSPSACSYHLRTLQKHGLVRDSRPRSDGRERLWEAVGRGFEWDPGADDDEQLAAAGAVLVDSLLQRSDARVLAYFGRDTSEPNEWREAAHIENATLRLTVGEMLVLTHTIDSLLERYRARTRDADEAPRDSRLVHAAVRFVPQLAAEPMLAAPEFSADASEPDPTLHANDR
jgi:DNA-binding transcriptional ArsR family regulator